MWVVRLLSNDYICNYACNSLGELRNLVSIFGRQSDNGISLEQVKQSILCTG